jgi:Aldehyde dehydrogenase family
VSLRDEAIEMANASEYSLSASLWTGDLYAAQRAALRIRAGQRFIRSPFLSNLTMWSFKRLHVYRFMQNRATSSWGCVTLVIFSTNPFSMQRRFTYKHVIVTFPEASTSSSVINGKEIVWHGYKTRIFFLFLIHVCMYRV